ncbi:MAG TPA: L-lactate permease [Candidatus Vogelbacteria bacterium]|nr:L-lactate permease [Candidatus Vogelbacteria bacterium]
MLIASLPFICLFFLILFFKKDFLISISTSLLILLIISISFWQITILRILSAGFKGFFIASEIIFIVFGALLILEIIKNHNLLPPLRKFFSTTCSDYRFQAILIAGALVHFIEGVAGFGTPALLAIPILLILGFKPLTAVCISLIGDSAPVIFGAIGLPVTHGIGSILKSFNAPEEMLIAITRLISIFNVVLIAFIFLTILIITTIFEKRPKKEIIAFIPFTILASLAVSLPALLIAYFIGPELPSVIGGFFGVAIIMLLGRKNLLLPKEKISLSPEQTKDDISNRKVLQALMPYLLVVTFLVISRLFLKEILTSWGQINIENIFNWPVDYQFYLFYSAGFILLLSSILSIFYLKTGLKKSFKIIKIVASKISRAYLVLIIVLVFVQVLIYSGDNLSNLPSLILVLAEGLELLLGQYWILVASFLGAFGSFLAGSATVSNLLLTGFQYNTALNINWSPVLILTLQGLGAGAGNMIALHNIVAALVVADSPIKENEIIKKNLPILFLYLLLIIILTISYLIFSRHFV